jgi:hypothetical protein
MSMGAARRLRHEPTANGSLVLSEVKSPGFVMSRGRRLLGWVLLVVGVALVAWGLGA